MRIEDFTRAAAINQENSARTNTQSSSGATADVHASSITATSDTDFSIPDLLQDFGRIVSQRQELMDSLPLSVQDRLKEAMLSSKNDFANGHAEIQQGLSGLVRENRVLSDAIRQVVTELASVDQLPEFAGSKALQTAVDRGLTALQNMGTASKNTPSPVAVLAILMDKALQTGDIGKELPQWVNAVGGVLDKTANDPAISAQLSKLISQMDPQITLTAQSIGQPELVKVWAAAQGWGTTGAASDASQTITSVLQGLVGDATGAEDQNILSAASTALSRTGRFELLVSNLASRPEAMSKLFSMLPEIVAVTEGTLPAKSEGKASAVTFDKLARSAPQWLTSLAEREQRPELLEFWSAANSADLTSWVELGQTERQQSAATLKELASTFEQPGMFRNQGDDSASRALMLQIALYAPGQEKPYPALIQIYEEKKDRGSSQPPEQEVWVKVSLETDYIGVVDLSFRLQDKKYLSIFTRFADADSASEFQSSLAEIRADLAATPFELKYISVAQRSSVGAMVDG